MKFLTRRAFHSVQKIPRGIKKKHTDKNERKRVASLPHLKCIINLQMKVAIEHFYTVRVSSIIFGFPAIC
jgi:hypothetical protein